MVIATQNRGRYKLHAYVLPGYVWRPNEAYGRVAFGYIYKNRPNGARYAVAGHYNVALHDDEIVVWDLFEAKKLNNDEGIRIVEPIPRLKHTDLDAAIMATVLLYDGGER